MSKSNKIFYMITMHLERITIILMKDLARLQGSNFLHGETFCLGTSYLGNTLITIPLSACTVE
jgi:hypothetical protein